MKLLKLVIEGFGKFRDLRLPEAEDFAPGLVVVAGANESGKSTLLAFVRRMLYGFPDGRRKENPYPPLAGGQHGGRVLVEVGQGRRIWIERFSGKKGGTCVLREDNGPEVPAAVLSESLGHVTREVFESVFAFGLDQLTSLEALDQEGVRERIYSAGLGTGVSPVKASEDIQAQQDDLLRKRVGKARINNAIASLVSKQQELRALGDLQAEYDRLSLEFSDAAAESERLTRMIEDTRREIEKTRRLAEAFPAFVEVSQCQEEQADLGDREFPHAGIERFEELQDRLAERRAEVERLAQSINTNTDRLSALEVDETLLQHSADIELLHQGLESFRNAQIDLPKRKVELEAAERTLSDDLKYLGPEWTEEGLAAFDTSLPRRETIRQWRARRERSEAARQDAVRGEESARRALEDAERARDAAHEELAKLAEPKDVDTLAGRRQALRQVRAVGQELSGLEAREVSLDERLRDLESEVKGRVETAATPRSLPRWPSWAAVAVGVLAGAVLLLARQAVAAAIALVLGFAMAGVMAWARRWQVKLAGSAVEDRRRRSTEVDAQRSRLTEQKASVEQRRAELVAALSEPLKLLGLEAPPSPSQLEAMDAYLEGQVRTAEAWSHARSQMTAADKAVERAAQALEKARSSRQQAEAADQAEEAAYASYLGSAGLPAGLSPEGALEFLSKAEAATAHIQPVDSLRHRIAAMKDDLKAYLDKVAAVLRACGRSEEEVGPEAVERLMQHLQNARTTSLEAKHLDQARQELEQERDAVARRIAEDEAEVRRLFSAAGVSDEEAFRKAGAEAARRVELQNAIVEARGRVELLLGTADQLEQGIAILRKTTPEELEAKLGDLAQARDTLAPEGEAARERVGELRQQIKSVETNERASRLRTEIRSLQEDVTVYGSQWSVLAIARALLRQTQQQYEKERRPKVIEEAETFFGTITGGRYGILAPLGEARLDLCTANGERKRLEELSRGTAEQLYLSLRFGYIRELARQGASPPVIMDDVLVNFDPKRAKGAAAGLAQLAESHQVFLFTCHPETVSLIQEVAPAAQVVTLVAT